MHLVVRLLLCTAMGSVAITAGVARAQSKKVTLVAAEGTKSPFGKCLSYSKTFTREDAPLNAANFRSATLVCPSGFSLATSSNIIPACNSSQWAAFVGTGDAGVPDRAECTLRFAADLPGIDAATLAGQTKSCLDLKVDIDIATCQVLCCNL